MSAEINATISENERLWRAVTAGDKAAFEEVVELYQGAISAIAFSVLGDFAASQDVTQDTFWAAWQSRDQLRQPQRLGSWLCGIGRNLAHEWRRRNRRLESNRMESLSEPAVQSMGPVEQSISAEEESIVWNSLQGLPENYREVLALYYRQGKTATQVALALELNEDTVKQRLSRGRTLLREQVATLIEDVLVRSRPGKSFTAKVMAGIIGVSAAAQTGGTAVAATAVGAITGGTASGVATVAAKSVMISGAASGFAGGLIGAAGGLGGSFIGTWLPAELAPTATEREVLRTYGRRQFRAGILYTLVIFAATPLLFMKWGGFIYFVALAVATMAFMAYVIVQVVRFQRIVREVRQRLNADNDPNLSPFKQRFESLQQAGRIPRLKGRSFTSSWRLLSLPLVDVQFSDPFCKSGLERKSPRIARGWIAIGDRAQGVLLGIGGVARGFFAFGGISIGAVSFGGLSLGVVGIGGLAVGLLSVAGLAIGHTAIGGGALGCDAAGGAAIGWHSAAGGLAVSNHVSMGGVAVARDFAVGGQAIAAQTNTHAAQQAVDTESLQWVFDWLIPQQFWFIAGTIILSLAPVFLSVFFYQRNKSPAIVRGP